MKCRFTRPCLKLVSVSILLITLSACGGGGGNSAGGDIPQPTPGGGGLSPPDNGPDRPITPPGASYEPLSWSHGMPLTQYVKSDGTLVTRIGIRTRDRHVRENFGPSGDNYNQFAPHYFEKRTLDLTIYDNADPVNPAQRILTITIRPQWWLFDLNFRYGYMGFVGDSNKYNENRNAYKIYKVSVGQTDIRTPIQNFDSLQEDDRLKSGAQDYPPPAAPPDGDYLIVEEIRMAANALDGARNVYERPLKAGDLVEMELGVFLAGEKSVIGPGGIPNRFNYYSDAVVYQVGKTGAQPWVRQGGSDSFSFENVRHPMSLWPALMPEFAKLGGGMSLQEDTSYDPARRLMQAAPNIAGYNVQPWIEGRRLFHTSFLTGAHTEVDNPIFIQQANKVGPHLSQTHCASCHVSDGKSSPQFGLPLNNMGVFIGDSDRQGRQIPDPRFGARLREGLVTDFTDELRQNSRTIDGREAVLSINSYALISGTYNDGSSYTLQRPQYKLNSPNGGELPLPPRLSVRAAPHLTGMGLLEAVPESELETIAHNQPSGMAGRLQIVQDPSNPIVFRVGRFGWKGGAPTVQAQVSYAFNDDMSVTTPLRPTLGCAVGSAGGACRERNLQNSGREPALSVEEVEKVTRYVSLLGVPNRRAFPDPLANGSDDEAQLRRLASQRSGEQLFGKAQCAVCHTETLTTRDHQFVELRNQTIHPYTDLLLHDMGNGLADNYLEGRALGSEWRTAPLWGIGLQEAIDPAVRYLHDGRARTLEEAILWHGGQAKASTDIFRGYSKQERDDVIAFLKSL